MTRPTITRSILQRGVFAAAALCLVGDTLTSIARADGISFVNSFRSNTYVQTGDGNTTSYNGSFYTIDLNAENAGNFTAATVSYPGPGSPITLTQQAATPTDFGYQSSSYATQAAMDADFPFGTYQFDATGGTSGPASTSYSYTADAFSSTTPYLAGTSYSDLQGMDPNSSLFVSFSTMTPDPSAADAFMFFTIRDNTTNTLVFDAGFLSSSTAGITIPGGTLLPNESYTYELIFSDRVLVPSPGADFDAQLGFDLRTSGTFTTSVPEVAGVQLIGIAGLTLVIIGTYRRLRHRIA